MPDSEARPFVRNSQVDLLPLILANGVNLAHSDLRLLEDYASSKLCFKQRLGLTELHGFARDPVDNCLFVFGDTGAQIFLERNRDDFFSVLDQS